MRGRRTGSVSACLGRQDGFTLIEVVIGMVLSLVAFFAVSNMMMVGLRKQISSQNRVSQLEEAQVDVQRLVWNLRQATSVTVTNASSLTYSEPVSTGTETVSFSCSGTTCTQTINGTSQTELSDLASTSIFTASPSNSSPTYIGISVEISASGHTPVTLTDGTGLRNVTLGT